MSRISVFIKCVCTLTDGGRLSTLYCSFVNTLGQFRAFPNTGR